MKEINYSCNCLMKIDLLKSADKLAFLKENWPEYGDIESINESSEKDLQCMLCFLNVVIDALAKDEFYCANQEIIRLVMTRTYVQNRLELCAAKDLRAKLEGEETEEPK